jgi:hypothetical protein
MTYQEKKDALQKMASNPRISKLWYSESLLKNNRANSIWYGGTVLSFTLDSKYYVSIEADGDVIGSCVKENGTTYDFKDKNNDGYVAEVLQDAGAKNDDDLIIADSEDDLVPHKGKVVVFTDYNNWFEVQISEQKEGGFDNLGLSMFNGNILDDFDDIFRFTPEDADALIKTVR